MKNKQSGFTLIELMIVIAIIGILASVAIPQYQVYTQRTEATNAIASVRTVQLAVQEHFSINGQVPAAIADLAPQGIDAAELVNVALGNDNINTVTLGYGVDYVDIVLAFSGTAPKDLAGNTLTLRGSASNNVIAFTIDATDANSIDAKFQPNL